MSRHKMVVQHCSDTTPFLCRSNPFKSKMLNSFVWFLFLHWSELLPHSDLSFRTDNPSVHRHVRCLSVWRTPLICPGEGFCDKHATSHQNLTLQNCFKEIWETTRVSHLCVLFGLLPRSCMSVFKCIWVGLLVCVCVFLHPTTSLLGPFGVLCVTSLNSTHHVTERSWVWPQAWMS